MWVTISLRRYRLFIIASDKSQFISRLVKTIITFNTAVVTAVRAGQNFKWSEIRL